MVLVQEILSEKLTPMKVQQRESVRVLRLYVEEVTAKYFNPATAPTSVVIELNNLAEEAYRNLGILQQWATTDIPDVSEFVSFIDSQIEKVIDKFWAWSDRRIGSVQEATALHNRSKSTIYRWIKSGKLNAQKASNGRWCIAL